jgi:hypothetical protein
MTTLQVPRVRVRATRLKDNAAVPPAHRALLTLKPNTVMRDPVPPSVRVPPGNAAPGNAPMPESARWPGRKER